LAIKLLLAFVTGTLFKVPGMLHNDVSQYIA
jgi:hypothetical protein